VAGFLFDAWPVLSQPPGNGLVVLLAMHALGLLRRVATLSQPRTQVVGVEGDTELLLNKLRQTRSRPQIRGEAVLGGWVGQPAQHDFLLSKGEFGPVDQAQLRAKP